MEASILPTDKNMLRIEDICTEGLTERITEGKTGSMR